VCNRVNGLGCPFCSGQRVHATNSLRTLYPAVAALMHPTKNGELNADGLTSQSKKKVWWICSDHPDHDHQQHVFSKTANGHGCPYCSGQALHDTNSLRTRDPSVLTEWHPDLNELSPDDVTLGSQTAVWWRCHKGHEWRTSVAARTGSARSGCPYCCGNLPSAENNLLIQRPDLASQWHPVKNGALQPTDILPGSKKSVWWMCESGHEWEQPVYERIWARTKLGRCRQCETLQSRFPQLAKELHPSVQGDVFPSTYEPVLWQCMENSDHVFRSPPAQRVYKQSGSCPSCMRAGAFAPIRKVFRRDENGYLALSEIDDLERFMDTAGLLAVSGKGKLLVDALLRGWIPDHLWQRFVWKQLDEQRLFEALVRRRGIPLQGGRVPMPLRLRRLIVRRDNERCQLCDARCQISDKDTHLDHFVPHALGGSSWEENLWTLCRVCNMNKGDSWPTEPMVDAWLASGRSLPREYQTLMPSFGPRGAGRKI
jgi:hypothetical protein